ncbi:MAG: cysteine hydrolase [Betaproteobacteria bacterium]|nr:cysteine hydrolase [Betaproteobacteria bacterium]
MNTPKTLMEIAGAPRVVARWESAALLLIDHQLEYVSGGLPLNGIEAAVAECVRLLELARQTGAPVFHIVNHGRPGGVLFNPEGKYVAIMPQLAPTGDETIVVKHLPNAFAGTELDQLLQASGRKQVVIAGFATHMCISATTRSALDHGYAATVVAAACATRDLPNPLGGVVPAATVHQATLAALADRFASVVPAADAWKN